MLNSTFELITLATSNSHLIFVISNLIIIVLLVNGMKAGDDDDNSTSTSSEDETTVGKVSSINIQITTDEKKPEKGGKVSWSPELDDHTGKSADENKKVPDDHSGDIGNNDDFIDTKIIDIEDENEENEDELRRRAEEFIEMTNKRWKQEKLATFISN